MPYMRVWRWQLAITAINSIEPNLEFLLGTLAKLDEELYLRDQRHKAMAKAPSNAKLAEWATVQDAIGRSYLWVLGAYEAIRTLDQRCREMGAAAEQRHRATSTLKHLYERLRIPLAKLEPSKRHSATDYAFPRPGIDDERGIAWEVSKGVVISRSLLSDEFLALLEGLQNGSLTN
jgi:hypothetical protein